MAAQHLTTGRAIGVDLWRTGDQSGNSTDATRRNALAEGVADRVELQTADMMALPLEDNSFDLVVASLAIHNIKGCAGRDKAIDEAVRVLRPGGRLMLQHADALRRVLVGFDFPYGYPAGLVEAAGLPAPAGKWLAIWTALAAIMNDDDQNRSNRFEAAAALNAMMTPPRPGTAPGPFWNAPAPGPLLTAASPAFLYTTRNNVSLSA